jgi:hypothetical protein
MISCTAPVRLDSLIMSIASVISTLMGYRKIGFQFVTNNAGDFSNRGHNQRLPEFLQKKLED